MSSLPNIETHPGVLLPATVQSSDPARREAFLGLVCPQTKGKRTLERTLFCGTVSKGNQQGNLESCWFSARSSTLRNPKQGTPFPEKKKKKKKKKNTTKKHLVRLQEQAGREVGFLSSWQLALRTLNGSVNQHLGPFGMCYARKRNNTNRLENHGNVGGRYMDGIYSSL